MGKKGTKRKTRWRILPIGGEDGCNGVCSNNEDEVDGDRDSASPLNNSSTISTSYARASSQQRMPRTKPTTTSSRGGSHNYRHRSYCQPHDNNQPLVTTEKKMFNEEEYTKITTPRQDVLFKKGYLGRKRPTAATTADSTANVKSSSINPDNTAADIANGNYSVNGTAEQSEEPIETDQITNSDMMSPIEEQPQYIYATNGYVDQTGGPPPVYYINGSGYELYDPYSGNVTVVVGPAPHFGGPGGAPPILAAVPCQPLPLQPFEWFNPPFLPYVTAPCHNGLASARDRRKRYSTDSQNCSPQSSESTEPPGSPQECEMEVTQTGEPPGPAIYTQAPAYVYPGYMFGPPMYNVNGVTVQGAPTQLPICDITGSNKRRKKKKRRGRRRGGAEDGCSEESSSDEKELEDPMSLTSQESSSQEIESDSKQSVNPKNDSSTSSPLSSCQTVTPTDPAYATTRKPAAPPEQSSRLNEFDSETLPLVNVQQSYLEEQESIRAPSVSQQDIKGTSSDHNKCDTKSVVRETEKKFIQELSQQSIQTTKDNSEDQNFVQHLKDQTGTDELDFPSSVCISSLTSVQQKDSLQSSPNCHYTPCVLASSNSADDSKVEKESENNGIHSSLTRLHTSESTNQEAEIDVQCNSECIIKTEDSTKPIKHKKSGKQVNVKHKKSPKGKEEKQKRLKASITNCSVDTDLERRCKKKDDIRDGPDNNEIVIDSVASTEHSSVKSIPSENTTETATFTVTEDSASSQKNITEDAVTVLNGLSDRFQISEPEAKSNSLIGMDGSEDKSASATNEPLSSEELVHSGRSSHTSRTGKHDLFPEFKSGYEEPPVRPLRKEKLKSSSVHSISLDRIPSDVSIKSSITAKPLKLPTISLRPDIPKTEPKCMHEVSSSQLKDSADILDSITAVLTTDPPVTITQATAHKDNPIFQEAAYTANALQSSKSSVEQKGQANTVSFPSVVQGSCSKVGEKLLDPQKGISDQATAISVEHETDTKRKKCSYEKLQPSASTSSQKENVDMNDTKNKKVFKDQVSEELIQSKKFQDEFEPPIPPPRGKKLHACKHKLTEHSQVQGWDLEGGNAADESSGDSTTSSTTHESEESVIELLSSTHTNPDDRLKEDLSSDEEEEIIFRAKVAHRKSEMLDIKSVPPDKSDVYSPSISGPSLQNSNHISYEDKSTTSRTFPKSQRGNISLQYSEIYADELSKTIVSEAVSEASKKRMCLPITEAVTRWLRCQSPDVLALPQPEEDTGSDSSSEEQESDESMADATANQQSTGQKNVFCNPLPVPLLEDRHSVLVNTNANHIGDNSGTGRRVALNDCQFFKLQNGNFVSEKYDNNGTNVSISSEGDKSLIIGYDDRSFIISHKRNCDSVTPFENSDPEKRKCLCQIKKSHEEENVLTEFSGNVTPNVNCNNQHGSWPSTISKVIPIGFNHKYSGMNTAKNRLQKEIRLTDIKGKSFQNISQDIYDTLKSSSEPANLNTNYVSQGKSTENQNGFHGKQPKNVNDKAYSVNNYRSDLLKEEDDSSCASEETLECEWDLWDCNLVKILPVLTTPKSQTPVEETLSETPVDYCSHMCDPTVSVAKYYSLGALQKKSVKFDEDEISSDATDSSDEEVDALKHFQYELEDDDGLQTAHLPSTGTGNSHKMSGEGHKRDVIYGNPEIYKAHYGESGKLRNSGVHFQEETDRCRNMYNATLSQRAQAAHLFHRKSSVLVSKLKGDGPFPCGGICCILQ